MRTMFGLIATLAIAAAASAEPPHAGDGGLRALHEAMLEGMRAVRGLPVQGQLDRDFVTVMVQHCQQAIAIAKVQLEHSQDARLRQQAQAIIASSEQQIARLQAWRQPAQ